VTPRLLPSPALETRRQEDALADAIADQPPHRDRYGPRWSPGGWCGYCPGYSYHPLTALACGDCQARWAEFPATAPPGWPGA
jgi:hypothetical protein